MWMCYLRIIIYLFIYLIFKIRSRSARVKKKMFGVMFGVRKCGPLKIASPFMVRGIKEPMRGVSHARMGGGEGLVVYCLRGRGGLAILKKLTRRFSNRPPTPTSYLFRNGPHKSYLFVKVNLLSPPPPPAN